jgi:hypothetical protein
MATPLPKCGRPAPFLQAIDAIRTIQNCGKKVRRGATETNGWHANGQYLLESPRPFE